MGIKLFELPDNINAEQMGVNGPRIILDEKWEWKISLSEETEPETAFRKKYRGVKEKSISNYQVYLHFICYMSGLYGRSERDHRRLFLADAFWDRSLCFPEAHSTVKIEICNFEKSVLLEQSTDRV